VSPFNGHPQGFSASALELLDQGLNQIWHEMQIAADAKTKDASLRAAALPSPGTAHVHNQGTLPLPALGKTLAAIAK